ESRPPILTLTASSEARERNAVPNRIKKYLLAGRLMSIARGTKLLVCVSKSAIGRKSSGREFDRTNKTPAGTPVPLAFAENKAGAMRSIWVAPLGAVPSALTTVNVAGPVAIPAGSRKFICVGETKKSGTRPSVPALSFIRTDVFARAVGRGCSFAD